MKKRFLVTVGITAAVLAASELSKKLCSNSCDAKAEPTDENITYKNDESAKKDEAKKSKNNNENVVRVNNSLITIKIKLFSK